jgi:hypothetical protein
MKLILACIIASWLGLAFAAEPASTWRWYYAAYGATSLDAKVFLRSGVANVLIDGVTLKIDLVEAAPGTGERPTFVGKIDGSRIAGKLKGFFPSGDEVRRGEYRERQLSTCRWRQISIFPEYPDASVLIISRIDGACQ